MLFIRSSVDGYLVCFYPLAVMHNTAMNTYGQVSVWTYVFISLGHIHRGAELLGHVVTLCLTLEELPDCFPKWPPLVRFRPAVYEGSSFCTPSLTLVVVYLFFIIAHGCEEVQVFSWPSVDWPGSGGHFHHCVRISRSNTVDARQRFVVCFVLNPRASCRTAADPN